MLVIHVPSLNASARHAFIGVDASVVPLKYFQEEFIGINVVAPKVNCVKTKQAASAKAINRDMAAIVTELAQMVSKKWRGHIALGTEHLNCYLRHNG